jgi:hypothetical protein
VTLPSVAQVARILPAVEWPMLAWAARSLVVLVGWACRAAHSLSSAAVRPAGARLDTACSARALRWARTLVFVLGMATSFTVSSVGWMLMPPGGDVAPVRCRWIGLRVDGRFLQDRKSSLVATIVLLAFVPCAVPSHDSRCAHDLFEVIGGEGRGRTFFSRTTKGDSVAGRGDRFLDAA